MTKVDIFNLALVTLGAQRIASPTENSKNASTCLQVYDQVRRGELRKKPSWNFAIKTTILAADVTSPLFDRGYAISLPPDFIGLANPYPESNYAIIDNQIQNGKIYTNFGAPFNLRYVADITVVDEMDPLFQLAVAYQLASVIGDSIVQSNAKIQAASARYQDVVKEARKSNAFDNVATEFPENSWLTVRY